MQSSFKLPGVYFQTEIVSVPSELPRMDIAGFVGFSTKGPLHIPVAIEDFSQYRDIFGDDIALAWDSLNNRMQYSLLGPTVESFFRNGGQRCWVVRVAKQLSKETGNGASVQRFCLPGLHLINNTTEQLAEIIARSVGSWADSYRVGTRLDVRLLSPIQPQEESSPAISFFTASEGDYSINIGSAPADLQVADLINIQFSGSSLQFYLFIDTIISTDQGFRLSATKAFWFDRVDIVSPPTDEQPDNLFIPLSEAEGLNQFSLLDTQSLQEKVSISLLRFDILAWQGEALEAQLTNLAFDSRHPRYWGNIPDDTQLFETLINKNPVSLDPGQLDLMSDVTNPRFPFAVKLDKNKEPPQITALPLSMKVSSYFSDSKKAQGDTHTETRQQRDGLEIFDADLFLDTDLTQWTTANLLEEAEHKRFIKGESLYGLYSLLIIDEISMISVPDLLHRHWDKNPPEVQDNLQAPVLEVISAADEFGRRTLSWNDIDDVRRYIIQESLSSDFDQAVKTYTSERSSRLQLDQNNEIASPEKPDPESELKISLIEECPTTYFYRIRAEGYGQFSPWSNSRALHLPETGFYNCEEPDPSLLGLVLSSQSLSSPDDIISFSWEAEDKENSLIDELNIYYQLQQAADADFVSAKSFDLIADKYMEVNILPDVVLYFRVRAITNDNNAPWSNTIQRKPVSLSQQTLNLVEDYKPDDLLAVQYALIRFCAARADCICVLSVPLHFQPAEVLQHIDKLLPSSKSALPSLAVFGTGAIRVQSLKWSENLALGYTCIYYPWLQFTVSEGFIPIDNNSANRLIPAEGAACGKMATTTINRGAWISSANKPLRDVLGVSIELNESNMSGLINKQVNVIRELPDGFVCSHDNTLSKTSEFKPVNVRRLLILLRRLALREGNAYVFEPNSVDFRNNVQHYWEQLLINLYQRGAFLGDTANDAFRVVTDESVNDRRAQELGRFIIHLLVAPSQPMRFINIRLIQSGADRLQIQEL